MRLSSIRITGANHTRGDFLARVAFPYLSSSPQPSTSFTSSLLSLIYPTRQASASSIDDSEHFATTETLRQVLAKTRNLSDDLRKFGIFEGVEPELDRSRHVLADPYDVDLLLRVKESSRYFLRTATDVGDGEGNAVSYFDAWPTIGNSAQLPFVPSRLRLPEYAMHSEVQRSSRVICRSAQGRSRTLL